MKCIARFRIYKLEESKEKKDMLCMASAPKENFGNYFGVFLCIDFGLPAFNQTLYANLCAKFS